MEKAKLNLVFSFSLAIRTCPIIERRVVFMVKLFKLADTRNMSKAKIQRELSKCRKKIEELGMEHEEACDFISSIMNLGIAINEKNQK